MRYCPHCRRFNEGKPQICHFCGRTWHIKLCPRGHENPYNAQYCGACGSADLTETAGPQSWLMILVKAGIWFLVSLFVYEFVTAFFSLLKPSAISHFLSLIILVCLFIFGLNLVLSFLPPFIGNGFRRIMGLVRKLMVKVGIWFLGKLWEVLR